MIVPPAVDAPAAAIRSRWANAIRFDGMLKDVDFYLESKAKPEDLKAV